MPGHSYSVPQPCLACNWQYGTHGPGYCPLKLAGPEYCNLCGQAHFGVKGACLASKDEAFLTHLISSLKNSPEPPWIVDPALKLAITFKSEVVRKTKELKERKELKQRMAQNQHRPAPNPLTDPQTVQNATASSGVYLSNNAVPNHVPSSVYNPGFGPSGTPNPLNSQNQRQDESSSTRGPSFSLYQ